jgi:hypothetical protein
VRTYSTNFYIQSVTKCFWTLTFLVVTFASSSPAFAASSTIQDNLAQNRCFDIPGSSTAPSTRLEIWDCNGGANQQFTVNSSTHQITVYSGSTLMCLNAQGGSSANGTPVIIWPCNSQANEQWTYNSSLKTITGLNGACISIPNSNPAGGTFLQLETCNGSTNQKFNVAGSGPGVGTTTAGVPLPSGWSLGRADTFGTRGTVGTFAALHAKYYEAQYYNRAYGFDNNSGNPQGLVTIPNPAPINGEQGTYTHFENTIAFSSDHLTIQARGQSNNTIATGELVSPPLPSRNFCVEARYQISNVLYGWPAFWFYGDSPSHDSSEIDVEQPTPFNFSQGVNQVSLYNHPTAGSIAISNPAFTTQWMMYNSSLFNASTSPHYYTICYNDSTSTISRYIDGGLIYTAANWKWNSSLGGTGYGPNPSMILNLAVGGWWPGDTPTPSKFSSDLAVYSIEYYWP